MKTLTWKVRTQEPAPCPDYQPDPYTGQYPSTHCLVYHYKDVIIEKTKEFATEKEAKIFAVNAPNSCYDFKLNGKLLKDTRKKDETLRWMQGNHLTTTSTVTDL